MKSGTCFSRTGLFGASAFALALGFSGVPALSLEDDGRGSVFESMIELVMPGDQPVEGNIQYRERAPLVVPPNRKALPTPQESAAKRTQSWPKDQEVARREAEKAAAARPRVDEVANPVSRQELDRIRTTSVQGPGSDRECNEPLGRPCNQEAFWAGLRSAKSSGSDDKVILQPGKEPQRKVLTEPPAGFRKPTTIQQYTFEVGKEENLTDARAQTLEEARRRSERQ